MNRRQDGPLRIASLCGTIKPHFSGTEDYHTRLLTALEQAGAATININMPSWRPSQLRALLRTVFKAAPDIVLMQYPTDAFGRSLLPQMFASVQMIAPLVLTLHEFVAAHPLRRLALVPILVRSKAVVQTAERERAGLRSWYPFMRGRSHVIPLGNTFPPLPWTPDETPLVAYFGQVRPAKGLEQFITSRDALVKVHPQARFVIIGSRLPQFAEFHATIAAMAQERDIEMLEGLSEHDVSAILARAQCALLPFPDGASFRRTSLLAAAACGVPIVTLSGPDTPPEMIDLLHPATTADELTAQTDAILTDSLLRHRSHEQSLQLAVRTSWDSIASLYMGVFAGLTGGHPAPMAR